MALKRSFEHDRDSSSSNPFESRTPSPKRQRRCFPMTVVSSPTTMTNETTTTESTVFPDVQPIVTTDVLLTRIKEEVRRLQRRHQLKHPTSSDLSGDDDNNQNECRSSTNQQHLLTLKQVNIICARLLKEREEKIREEYDRILSNKLNEQYEGFVRFTQDQLTRRFSELQFSYVS
jgi:hypothetical protein